VTWDWQDLYRRARAIGMPAASFWDSTPAELMAEFDAHAMRTRAELDTVITHAWFVEYVHLRAATKKRLESLRTYLQAHEPPQTLAQQKAALTVLAEAWRIPRKES